MNLSASDKDKFLRIGVISAAVLIVLGTTYWELRTPDVPPPVIAPVIVSPPARTASSAGGSGSVVASSAGAVPKAAHATTGSGVEAGKVGTTASQYDPTLKMEAMLVTESLRYSGAGRNIFSGTSVLPPINIPKPIASVRTGGVTPPVNIGPTLPPPLPPIDLKFFGTATMANGGREAFLLHGEDVFLASTGNIVQRRYKIGAISANAVEVEDLTNNNKQSLPLTKN